MPAQDGTGPYGQGPLTGRGMGRCRNQGRGFGFGRGRGQDGCRFWNRSYTMTDLEEEQKYLEEELKAVKEEIKEAKSAQQ